MTTTARKNNRKTKAATGKTKTGVAASPQRTSKKPLRIRPELLPDTATYGTFAGKEYLMIPVEDFGDWYEDVTLGAVAQDRLESDDGPALPLADFVDEIVEAKSKRKAAGK